jgi:hypothetical protein
MVELFPIPISNSLVDINKVEVHDMGNIFLDLYVEVDQAMSKV